MAAAFAFGALFAACREAPGTPARPAEVTAGTACSLDGMLLADYPGPKAQIHYASGTPDFFCDTVEMFSIYLQPEQQKRVAAIYVQDIGATDWDTPAGHWIDARTATYVHGSRKRGSMGPTIASFAREADARSFATANGGRLLRFDEVTADLVALDGGALRDSRM
jgi:copper chaperone NosL